MTFTGSGLTQTQNFDGLPTNTTNNNIDAARIGHNWYRSDGSAQTQALSANIIVGTNTTSTSHGVYNCASSGASTDRAVGGVASGSGAHSIGVELKNTTGSIISSFNISGNAEKYRNGSSNAVTERVVFEYSTNATSLTSGTWTAITDLDLIEPSNTNTTTSAGIDGNLAANKAAFTGSIASLTLADNASVWIRWRDTDASGTDALLALDDVSITATLAAPTGPSLSISVSSLTNFGSVNVGANSTSSSFTVSGSLLTADAVITAPSTDFQVSLDNAVFSSSVQIPFGSGTLTNVPVYVRFTPQSGGAKSGNVTVASTGATSKTVGVSGTGVGPTASLSGTLTESSLNGASFTITLTNDTFINPLSASGFTLNSAPSGVSIASVTYLNATTATVVLSYNDTDFDSNSSMNVTIAANQLTSNAQLTSGNITVTAVAESIASAGTLAFSNVCINTTSDLSFTLTGTVKAGTINLTAAVGYTFSLTNGSNYTSTLSFPVSAGSLNQTIYVRFAPIAVQAYVSSTTISGGGASSSVVKNITGSGVNTVPTVTTPTSANVLATSATLGGNVTAAGCGTITERGVYYSTTNGFGNGAGTKVSETGTFTTGTFTVPVTGLSPNTVYYYKAFAINTGGAAYSTQGTFTTPTQAVTVPYTQNFEGTVTDFYYEVYPGSGTTNAWAIGSATNNGGTKALYISNNGGTTNAYTANSTTQTGAKIRVDLTGQTAATLTFDWKSMGEWDDDEVYDFGEVYITSGGTEYLLSDDYEFINSSVFSTKQLNLTPYVGGIVEIEFYWQNDNGISANPPFSIDNISITSGSAPVVTTAAATSIEQTAATLGGNVTNDGGSAVTARGVVYNTTGNPTLSDMGSVMGTGTGSFQAEVTGLTDNTTYYVRAYATNAFGTDYGDEVQFTTTILPAPVANEETTLTAGGVGFTANWEAVEGAASYRLDVSTSNTFGTTTPTTVTEGFAGGTTPPAGYTYTGLSTYNTAASAGVAIPSISFNDTADQMITAELSGAATQLSFWAKLNGSSVISSLLVEGYNGSTWVTIQNITNLPTASGTTFTYSSGTTPALPANITQFRFTYSKDAGNLAFDDLSINYGAVALNVLPGYGNLTVSGTSQAVTGLVDGNTYYYRVRAVSANSTSLNSNVITATADTVYEWNGTTWAPSTPGSTDVVSIAGSYNTNTNGTFDAQQLFINSGILTVASGTTLEIEGAVENNATAANFIVENGGNFIQHEEGDNTGNMTIYRDSNELFKLDYTFWSSPVAGQNLYAFSPATNATRFYSYGSSGTESYNSITPDNANVTNNGTTNFVPGRGYLIRMPNVLTDAMTGYPANTADYSAGSAGSIFHGQFTGVPNNGTITLPYTVSNGFNGVGNPYPSPINVTAFFTDNSLNMEPGYGIFFWRKKNDSDATSYAILSVDSYVANDGGVESPDEGQYTYGGQQWETYFATTPDNQWTISQGQGFFVRAATGATEIEFNNDMRQSPVGGQPFFRNANTEPVEKSKLWFNLSATGQGFSQTSLVYNPEATMGIDFGRDARHFTTSGLTAVYTFADADKLVIQSRPAFEDTDVVPLGYRVNNAGEFTITLHRKEGVFEGGQKVYLRDNVLGIIHDIKNGAYIFTTEAGTFDSRFDIIYKNGALATNDNVIDANTVVVYKQDGTLKINSGNADMQTITVYDLRGRIMYSANGINSTEHNITNLAAQQQVLLVEINTTRGKVTKKVIY